MLLNIYVKPDQPVTSYLTPLTGYHLLTAWSWADCRLLLFAANRPLSLVHRLTADVLKYNGVSFVEAVAAVRQCLPQTATLVGQNVGQDIEWLRLKEGTDFKACASGFSLGSQLDTLDFTWPIAASCDGWASCAGSD